MFNKNLDPITIVVHDGRYDMFGPNTRRSAFLAEFVKANGGINESVADGTYHFNLIRKGFKLIQSLTPAE